jgi:hypothetical protein
MEPQSPRPLQDSAMSGRSGYRKTDRKRPRNPCALPRPKEDYVLSLHAAEAVGICSFARRAWLWRDRRFQQHCFRQRFESRALLPATSLRTASLG